MGGWSDVSAHLCTNGSADFERPFCGKESLHQGQPEIQRGPGAARGEQRPIGHDSFIAEDFRQFRRHAKMGCVPPPGQQTSIV